jgi:type I restriction enzyme S subunit
MGKSSPPSNGWSQVKLSKIIRELPSGVSVNGEDHPAGLNEVGVLKVSSVSNGRFFPKENKVITGIEVERARMPVQRGDLLISRSNTFELVGASGMACRDYPNLFLPDKLWKVVLDDPTRDSTEWLLHLLNSSAMRQSLKSIATGTSGSMKNISKPSFLSIRVLRPTFAEQRKIAAILSTWDRAIELTEKLIDAKKKRKQALMQQLLTGKVRFIRKNAWNTGRLSDIANIEMGTSPPGSTYNSIGKGVPLVNGPTEFTERFPVKMQWTTQPTKICEPGDILLCVRGSSTGRINISNDHYCIGRGVAAISSKNVAVGNAFIENALIWHIQKILALTTGSTFPSIDKGTLCGLEVPIPPSFEQKAIGELLEICEREIAVWRYRSKALSTQKEGLMQQLLTGKVRVNVDAETVKG